MDLVLSLTLLSEIELAPRFLVGKLGYDKIDPGYLLSGARDGFIRQREIVPYALVSIALQGFNCLMFGKQNMAVIRMSCIALVRYWRAH